MSELFAIYSISSAITSVLEFYLADTNIKEQQPNNIDCCSYWNEQKVRNRKSKIIDGMTILHTDWHW